ncbi:MAG: TetR/AcrR family transcriptional regulator [Actinomycetaceae bacterium]|nr:TetR/AcrR family transcriptional regulator [Actinomycetaceae bacterium]
MGNRFETQDKLIAATRQILISDGIEGCTLENICSRAGFTRGAFYSNFATKESLLGALAEDEYANLIDRLREQVQKWAANPHHVVESRVNAQGDADGANQHLVMEDLLFEALDAIGVDKELYVIHSELLTRSVRDADWGARLLDLNKEFIAELSNVLTVILQAVGRQPTQSIRALTHSVVGLVMRAAGIAAWRTAAYDHPREYRLPQSHFETVAVSEEKTSIADSPARDIVEMILILLYAASEPS